MIHNSIIGSASTFDYVPREQSSRLDIHGASLLLAPLQHRVDINSDLLGRRAVLAKFLKDVTRLALPRREY